MAEEFLSRLDGLEKKIDGLGETLIRMITILGNVTDLKSDLTMVKEELMESIKTIPQPPAPVPGVTKEDLVQVISALPKVESTGGGLSAEQVSQIVKAELAGVLEQVLVSMSALQAELNGKIEAISISAAAIPTAAPAAATPQPMAGAPASSSTVSPDTAIKIADQLDVILKSLRMGCKAGPVLETMNDAKAEIMKLVSSDPIMIKIDKWTGIVNTYSLRHELQAKDILKMKKDIKSEIPKYRPA
ncbi:MAG: hypothetical protein KAR33_04635 [Candidatus Thorarchaeota archaeon]|nr:hypothetical protein [Candidatus Thorarchaeota archaeon]